MNNDKEFISSQSKFGSKKNRLKLFNVDRKFIGSGFCFCRIFLKHCQGTIHVQDPLELNFCVTGAYNTQAWRNHCKYVLRITSKWFDKKWWRYKKENLMDIFKNSFEPPKTRKSHKILDLDQSDFGPKSPKQIVSFSNEVLCNKYLRLWRLVSSQFDDLDLFTFLFSIRMLLDK